VLRDRVTETRYVGDGMRREVRRRDSKGAKRAMTARKNKKAGEGTGLRPGLRRWLNARQVTRLGHYRKGDLYTSKRESRSITSKVKGMSTRRSDDVEMCVLKLRGKGKGPMGSDICALKMGNVEIGQGE